MSADFPVDLPDDVAKLRHPSFLGLRRDLEPETIGLEQAKSAGK